MPNASHEHLWQLDMLQHVVKILDISWEGYRKLADGAVERRPEVDEQTRRAVLADVGKSPRGAHHVHSGICAPLRHSSHLTSQEGLEEKVEAQSSQESVVVLAHNVGHKRLPLILGGPGVSFTFPKIRDVCCLGRDGLPTG